VVPGSPLRDAEAGGVRVLVERGAAQRRGLTDRFPAADLVSEDEVARLLLDPDVRTVWR
jgi:hypothetical protein